MPDVAYCQSPTPTDPYVYVIVWADYPALQDAILTYEQDLENAGFSVKIKRNDVWPYLPDNAEGIRELLRNEASTHEIAGVMLVGDVPYITYKMELDNYTDIFPCDLYYMDLDGNWTDSDSDGIYDEHNRGDGDLGPEMWVGRLWASNIPGDEDELLVNYFDKNHRFRTGELTLPRRALAYIDDHALNETHEINSSLNMIYGNETTLVIDTETTNATDYKNRLNNAIGYEWLHLEAHGNYKKHAFRIAEEPVPASWTYINYSEIRSIDPNVFFYNIMACDSADYSQTEPYVGGSYLFADTYGLLVVSSTKKGKMYNYNDFYEIIANGKSIGQALIEWFEKNVDLFPFYCYGLTILGDPTLRVPRTYNQTRDVAITSITAGNEHFNVTQVHSGWNVSINVTVRNKGVFVETVNVTLYINDSFTEKQTVNLFPYAYRILRFIWNTTDVLMCRNYTMSANISSVIQGEANTGDNFLEDGDVYVRLTGDVNGDGLVLSNDIIIVQKIANYQQTVPPADPYADTNGDGLVLSNDIIIIQKIENYQTGCPP